MSERQHYLDLSHGAHLEGWEITRIADGSLGKKPFDFFGVTNTGIAIALEVKEITQGIPPHSLPMKCFEGREHQITWLNLYADRGAIALVAVYHKPTRRMMLFDTSESYVCDLRKIGGFWRQWPISAEWVRYLVSVKGSLHYP